MSDFKIALESIKERFNKCNKPEELYQMIISLGSELPQFDNSKKIEDNLVKGCQSLMYITTSTESGRFFFTAYSDALISKGLAALLYLVYQGQTLETVIHEPPVFLKEWGILSSLSPTRSNGVLSLYLRMKHEAIKHLARTTAHL